MGRALIVTMLSCQLICACLCIIKERLVSCTWPWQWRDGRRAGRPKEQKLRAKCLHRPRPHSPHALPLTPDTHACDRYTAPLWHDNSTPWTAAKSSPRLKRGQLYFVSQKRESKGLWVDKEPESIAGRSINWLMNHSPLLAYQKWLHFSGLCVLHLPKLNREPVADSNPSKGQQEVAPTNQEVHLNQNVPGQSMKAGD